MNFLIDQFCPIFLSLRQSMSMIDHHVKEGLKIQFLKLRGLSLMANLVLYTKVENENEYSVTGLNQPPFFCQKVMMHLYYSSQLKRIILVAHYFDHFLIILSVYHFLSFLNYLARNQDLLEEDFRFGLISISFPTYHYLYQSKTIINYPY